MNSNGLNGLETSAVLLKIPELLAGKTGEPYEALINGWGKNERQKVKNAITILRPPAKVTPAVYEAILNRQPDSEKKRVAATIKGPTFTKLSEQYPALEIFRGTKGAMWGQSTNETNLQKKIALMTPTQINNARPWETLFNGQWQSNAFKRWRNGILKQSMPPPTRANGVLGVVSGAAMARANSVRRVANNAAMARASSLLKAANNAAKANAIDARGKKAAAHWLALKKKKVPKIIEAAAANVNSANLQPFQSSVAANVPKLLETAKGAANLTKAVVNEPAAIVAAAVKVGVKQPSDTVLHTRIADIIVAAATTGRMPASKVIPPLNQLSVEGQKHFWRRMLTFPDRSKPGLKKAREAWLKKRSDQVSLLKRLIATFPLSDEMTARRKSLLLRKPVRKPHSSLIALLKRANKTNVEKTYPHFTKNTINRLSAVLSTAKLSLTGFLNKKPNFDLASRLRALIVTNTTPGVAAKIEEVAKLAEKGVSTGALMAAVHEVAKTTANTNVAAALVGVIVNAKPPGAANAKQPNAPGAANAKQPKSPGAANAKQPKSPGAANAPKSPGAANAKQPKSPGAANAKQPNAPGAANAKPPGAANAKPPNAPANTNNEKFAKSLAAARTVSQKVQLWRSLKPGPQKNAASNAVGGAIDDAIAGISSNSNLRRGAAWASLRAAAGPNHPKYQRIMNGIKEEIRISSNGRNPTAAMTRLMALKRNLKLDSFLGGGNFKGTSALRAELEAVMSRLSSTRGVSRNNSAWHLDNERPRRRNNDERPRRRNNDERPRRRNNNDPPRRRGHEEPEPPQFGGGGMPQSGGGGNNGSAAMAAMMGLPTGQQAALVSAGGFGPAQSAIQSAGGAEALEQASKAIDRAGGNASVAKLYNPSIPAASINAVVKLGGARQASTVLTAVRNVENEMVNPPPLRKRRKTKAGASPAKKKAKAAPAKVKKAGSKAAPAKKKAKAKAAPAKRGFTEVNMPPIPRPEVINALMNLISAHNLKKLAAKEIVGTNKSNSKAAIKKIALGRNKEPRVQKIRS
jgi:hypothetical protein